MYQFTLEFQRFVLIMVEQYVLNIDFMVYKLCIDQITSSANKKSTLVTFLCCFMLPSPAWGKLIYSICNVVPDGGLAST